MTTATAPFEHRRALDTSMGPAAPAPSAGQPASLGEESVIDNNTGLRLPCPPGPPPSSICLETNVIRFAARRSVMGSELPEQRNLSPQTGQGHARRLYGARA